MQKRIWELDALRGICVLGMVIVHFVYDLVELYGLVQWEYPALFIFVKQWGGVLFLLISGISVTLGKHHIRRGLIVFVAGLVCSLVTVGMYLLKFAGNGIIIYFGVLHCLGICMLLWQLVRKLPTWIMAILGIVLAVIGLWLAEAVRVEFFWLVPFGVLPYDFLSSDYFPLLPNFGFFLLGAVIGKTAYRRKESLLPKINADNLIIRFFTGCGRHSLWIYLLHQPLLSGIFYLILLLK